MSSPLDASDDPTLQSLPAFVVEAMKQFATPQVSECLTVARQIAGIEDLPDALRAPFLYFHEFITSPEPAFITRLRASKKQEHWYHRLVNGILGNTQSALECVYYHYSNVADMEARLTEQLTLANFQSIIGNSTIGIGNTKRLDFEYQAFVFAYRRTLEYFAGAIAAYFKSDCNSFKEMPKAISRPKTPTKLYEQLNQLHASGLESFAFVLSAGNNGRSIRDEIAHYSFVSAGCVNLSARGFVLAGGGEGLEPFSGLSLTEALKSRVDQLSGFLNESLRIFTDTLREHHSGDTMTTDGLAIDDTTKG